MTPADDALIDRRMPRSSTYIRLDHHDPLFARVVRGMEHVDRMLQGALLRRGFLR